ncbi:DNA-binding protein [Haloparvum sp. AD34]
MSDPAPLVDGLEEAQDAFDVAYHRGSPSFEEGIGNEKDWITQITKGCRLLDAADELKDTHYTAAIELSFGVIERSLQAFALAEGGDEMEDFDDHTYCYERASTHGLLSRDLCDELSSFYSLNRVESYYGGERPTDHQAEAMFDLADEIHRHAVNQIRSGRACICE